MSADLFGVITCFYGAEASTFMLLSEESQNTQKDFQFLASVVLFLECCEKWCVGSFIFLYFLSNLWKPCSSFGWLMIHFNCVQDQDGSVCKHIHVMFSFNKKYSILIVGKVSWADLNRGLDWSVLCPPVVCIKNIKSKNTGVKAGIILCTDLKEHWWNIDDDRVSRFRFD